MTNNFFFVTATVVLLPLIPAYILFKFLPAAEAAVDGPYSGLSLKLKGAFGGYFIVLLAVMSFFHSLPSDKEQIWTIKGRLVAPGIGNTDALKIVFVPDRNHLTPDLAFKMRILVSPGANGQPDWPDIVIDYPPLYHSQTVHLDQSQPDCKLTKANDEVDIAGDCLKLTKVSDTPAAFQSSAEKIGQ